MSLTQVYFWSVLAIPYLSYRGLPSSTIFWIISAYNIYAMVLEYPTGVISDVFGYKISVILAAIFGTISMILLAQSGNLAWYILCLSVLGLATSLISGSDMGLLNLVADNNLKQANSNYKFYTDLALFVSAIAGGLIANINFSLALYINAFFWILAAISLTQIKVNQDNTASLANIYGTAIKGFKYTVKNPLLLSLLILGMFVGGFGMNIKYIFGSFNEIFSLPVYQIGYLTGFGLLFRAFGAKLFPTFEFNLGIIGLIIAGLIGISGSASVIFAAVCIITTQFIIGYFLASLNAQIHDHAVNQYRASIFSLSRLTNRVFTSLYIAYIGYILGFSSFKILMLTTGSIILTGVMIYFYLIKLNQSKRIKHRFNYHPHEVSIP